MLYEARRKTRFRVELPLPAEAGLIGDFIVQRLCCRSVICLSVTLPERAGAPFVLLLSKLSRIPVIRQLFDVVHHAVELPLPVHLTLSA